MPDHKNNHINIRQATTDTDLQQLSVLAADIWRQHYKTIISTQQIEYMLQRLQSPQAMQSQISAGYQYHMLEHDLQPLAYFAFLPQFDQQTLHLSKLYVQSIWQRRGLGRLMLKFCEAYCKQQGLQSIWLTVNRHNQSAIEFYEHCGFVNVGELCAEIGSGYVMDDFKMLKPTIA